MNDVRCSFAQTVGGGNGPSFGFERQAPNMRNRLSKAQIAMYDFVAQFVMRSIASNRLQIKVSFLLRIHKIGFEFVDQKAEK